MAHAVEDLADLCVDTERVDLDILCTGGNIDLDSLCVTGVIDTDDLCTDMGDTTLPIIYRADTTLITSDNTSITVDYSL